jgi:ABC-type transporter Mla subunit MlaD
MDHGHEADPFRLRVAQYFLDSAGFHGMADTLSDTQKIDPTYPGIVTRVTKVLSQTTWPEDLHDQAQEFLGSLGTLSAALAADDTQAAIEASDTVHDAQHELSHALDHWMADHPAMSKEADPFNVSVAQYYLDSAGFHGMAETLSDTQKIDPTYPGIVTRVTKVLSQTTWPADLNDQAQEFLGTLNNFSAALAADDTQAAIETSDTVHDAQHELSHAIDHWLADHAAMSTEADPFNVSVAQYFLDSAGFHGMAEVLSDTHQINAAYPGIVTRVAKVLKPTTWPAELNDQAQAFIKSLADFAAALSDDNVAQAVELSDVVHDAQHELSHAIDAWSGHAHAH